MPADYSQTDKTSIGEAGGSVEKVEESSNQESLGKATGRGFSWLSLSLVLGKSLSFLAQIVLGAILLDEEFGIFAIATSVATFVRCFRDGGVPDIIVQKGSSKFEQLAGPAFWIGMWFSLAAGTALAVMSLPVANAYGDSRITSLLLVIAISLPLGAPAAILLAKLRSDMRFETVAMITFVSLAIRHLGAIALAFAGFGAMSFILPLIPVALFEGLAAYAATRTTPWLKGHQFAKWPGLLNNSLWVLARSFFRGISLNGDYLVLGLLVTKNVLGQYFFGYQLTAQVILVLSTGIQQILFPVLSRLTNETARQAKAILRSTRTLIFLSAPLCFGLAVVFEPLEQLLWGGKWAVVVPLIQIFALGSPLRGLMAVGHATLSARGAFQTSAWMVLLQGVLLVTSAAAGFFLFDGSPLGIAACVTLVQAATSTSLCYASLRSFNVSVKQLVAAILPAYSIALIAAIVTLVVDRYFLATTAPPARILELAVIFTFLFLVPMRILFRTCFDDLIGILPKRIADILQRLFFLNFQNDESRLKL